MRGCEARKVAQARSLRQHAACRHVQHSSRPTDEDDGGCLLVCHAEELAHQLGPIAQVLLDELRADLQW